MRAILEALTTIKTAKLGMGEDVFQQDLGNPSGPVLLAAKERLQKESAIDANWRYQPSRGVPELQNAFCARLSRLTNLGFKLKPKSHLAVTRGSKAGNAHLLYLMGDAIVPNPCYAIHYDGVTMGGHHATPYNCAPGVDILVEIEKACIAAPDSKVILVNLPHNPTGAVADSAFFPALVALARKYNKKVISDMAYGDLTFDGSMPQTLLQVPGAEELGVETWSMTKGHNMAGNVGFVVGNQSIVAKLADFQTNYGYGVFAPLQFGAAVACDYGDDAVRENCEQYRQRDKLTTDGLNSIGWPAQRSLATIYKWLEIPSGFFTAEEFCLDLLHEENVAIWPATGFINQPRIGDPMIDWTRHVRFSLVEPVDRIPPMIKAIGRFLKSR